MNALFNREHLLVIISTLFISLHMVDELVRKEGLPPPFIPLLVLTAIYSFLPRIIRAVGVIVLGAIYFFAQIPGHVLPWLQDGATGSDYSGWAPMVGGAILIGIGLQLLRNRKTH